MHIVLPDQIYRSLTDPLDVIRVFEVDGYRARVADAVTRRRERWMNALLLHATTHTVAGLPWRRGYVKETP